MTDTTAALAIVPFLIALTLALECTRLGCNWIESRSRRKPPQPAERTTLEQDDPSFLVDT